MQTTTRPDHIIPYEWFNIAEKQQSQAIAFRKLIDAARERRRKGTSNASLGQTPGEANHTAAVSTAVVPRVQDMLTIRAFSSSVAPVRGDPALAEQTLYPSCPIADALLSDPDSAPHAPVLPPYLPPRPHRDKYVAVSEVDPFVGYPAFVFQQFIKSEAAKDPKAQSALNVERAKCRKQRARLEVGRYCRGIARGQGARIEGRAYGALWSRLRFRRSQAC